MSCGKLCAKDQVADLAIGAQDTGLVSWRHDFPGLSSEVAVPHQLDVVLMNELGKLVSQNLGVGTPKDVTRLVVGVDDVQVVVNQQNAGRRLLHNGPVALLAGAQGRFRLAALSDVLKRAFIVER